MKKLTWQRVERILKKRRLLRSRRRKFTMFPYDERTGNWRPEGLAYTMMTWHIGFVPCFVGRLPIMVEYRVGVPEFKISYWLPELTKDSKIRTINPVDITVTTEEEFIEGLERVYKELACV